MQLLFWFGTFVAAWVAGSIGLVLVLPLGLIVVEWLIFPLALAIAGLLAALSAAWAGAYLASDQTQTRLLPVVGVTVVAAMGVALLFLLLVRVGIVGFGPLVAPALICSLILAFSATIATGRFRRPLPDKRGDIRLTVTLLVLAVVSLPTAVFLASLFGLAGA